MKKKFIVLMTGLLAMALAAQTPANAADKAAEAATGVAHIRVLQATPDGATLNVQLNDKTVNDKLAPLTLSDYYTVPAGKCHMVFTGSEDQAKLWNSTRTIEPHYYTVVLFQEDGDPALEMRDESANKITKGKARIYFFNMSPDAGDLRITVASERAKDGNVRWLKSVRAGSSRTKSAPTGDFTLQLRHETELFKEFPNFKVEPGQRLSVFILGNADSLHLLTIGAGGDATPSSEAKIASTKVTE